MNSRQRYQLLENINKLITFEFVSMVSDETHVDYVAKLVKGLIRDAKTKWENECPFNKNRGKPL